MVDSGHYKHPFFINRGYRVAPVVLGPAAANPLADESGHGTGESANIFATAPDVDLMPVKINFVNSTGAFNAAVALKPDIITCSWGSSVQSGPLGAANTALAAAIAAAVASGIIVIFSAGNGHWGFPGQHPDVISAGGVYMNPDETLRASDYASGFMSNIYPNRRVPDLSGLVGMRPKAIYIMLPVEPNDDIDSKTWNAGGLQGGTHPNGDETLKTDGWGAFSGTSAAAPQLAGVAALIKQACSKLTPQQVRNIMMKTARDVTAGKSHPNTNQAPNVGGNSAVVGPDTATGNGLVDAYKAVLSAKLACLTPIGPITVGPPILPPVLPPVTPPITPVSPIVGPITPVQPILPITPITPITPIQPITPPITPPIVPPVIPPPPPLASAASQAQGATGLTQEDVEALTEMVANDEIDLDM
jgi:subtilisin family serine protease